MDRPVPFADSPERVPVILRMAGVGILLLMGVEVAHVLASRSALWRMTVADVPGAFVVGVATSVPFVLGIVYGGRYLDREPFDASRNPRVFAWFLAGTLGFLGINVLTMVSLGAIEFWLLVAWGRWAVALGGGIGLLIGVIEAQAIANALEAEEARLRAEYVRSQRDTLDYINSLLRHEVLNSVNVIEGYGTELGELIDDSSREQQYVEPIVRRCRDVERVVTDARRLMEAIQEGGSAEPVNLGEILSGEVQKLRDSNGGVRVHVDVPEDTWVLGDEMLSRVFGNLLANAREHNDSDRPRVSVVAERDDDEVRVRVSDNGPGIDPDERESLFERPDVGPTDHGVGLYISDRLCHQYDGSLDLTETGPDGTTFTVTLPRVEPSGRSMPPRPVPLDD